VSLTGGLDGPHVQIESITFRAGWQVLAEALDHIRKTLAGEYDATASPARSTSPTDSTPPSDMAVATFAPDRLQPDDPPPSATCRGHFWGAE